jgi:hypothetical protein
MRSYDRTLLASLGFSDPDKRDPVHDWACQYVAQYDVATKLARNLVARTLDACEGFGMFEKPAFEVAICKGEDQYKTIIGFIDVVLWFSAPGPEINFKSVPLSVEVKTNPVPIGDILRQVNLYRQFTRSRWVVCTTFPLNSQQIAQLDAQRISNVLLGKDFHSFCERQRTAKEGGGQLEI